MISRDPEFLYYPQRSFCFEKFYPGTENKTEIKESNKEKENEKDGEVEKGIDIETENGKVIEKEGESIKTADTTATADLSVCSDLNILVNQSIANVGTTVWDAEVILAYYLHALPQHLIGDDTFFLH